MFHFKARGFSSRRIYLLPKRCRYTIEFVEPSLPHRPDDPGAGLKHIQIIARGAAAGGLFLATICAGLRGLWRASSRLSCSLAPGTNQEPGPLREMDLRQSHAKRDRNPFNNELQGR